MRLRALIPVLLLVCLAAPAAKANEKRFGYCQLQLTGARVTNCQVTVYLNGTLTKATIFSDNLNTPLANPFAADPSTGLWFFYSANGRYDVQLSGGVPAISPAYTLSDYLLNDPAAVGAFIQSPTANGAQSGFIRLAPSDCISWRNTGNTQDNCLTDNGSGILTYGGAIFATLSNANSWSQPQTFTTILSATTPTAATGFIRMGGSDTFTWRKQDNSADVGLSSGAAVGNIPVDTIRTIGSAGIWANVLMASAGASVSATGNVRIDSGGTVNWRNQAGSGDIALSKSQDTNDFIQVPTGFKAPAFVSSTGTLPAQTGAIRLNYGDVILSRNFGNTADINFMGIDSQGFLDIGNTSAPPFIFGSPVTIVSGLIEPPAPIIGNGANITIQATNGQNISNPVNGGSVILTPGTGVHGGINGTVSVTAGFYFYPSSLTFATLGSPTNGALVYCSDCTIANPCASGGTGAMAKRLNAVWVCN